MSAKMRLHSERAQRVDLFMDEGVADFPANSKGGILAASLKEENANLSGLATARAASKSKRQQGTAGRRAARTSLRELVEAVADTARSAAREHTDIAGIFDLAGKDRSDQTLIATARHFADKAATFAGLLVEYGLPPTIVNDLNAGADSLERYITLQEAGASDGVSTTVSSEESYRRLADLVERLDPIVRNKYRNDHVKIAAWERARRLESGSNSKANGDSNTPPPPSSAQ